MQYIITPEANTVWASTGAIVSPHKGVGTDAYPNDLVVREARVAPERRADPRTTGPTCCPPASPGEQMGAAAPAGDPGQTDRLGRLPDARQGRLGRRVTERLSSSDLTRAAFGPPVSCIREGGADGCRSARWGRRGRRGDDRGTSHSPATPIAGRRWDRAVILFLGPTALLMLIFLIYPTIYTIALSFNRGRRGEFTEWVGLQHYIGLLNDKCFINLSTFPPSGAIWNNVLWAIFYTSFVIFLGLIVAVLASRVRYESIIKAVVFLPMAIAATALAIIWNFVYAPDPNIGLLNAILDPFTSGEHLVARQPRPRQRGADRGRHLGFRRVRDGHPLGGPQEHPGRGARGRPNGRRERAADLLPDHPADGQPADLGAGSHAAGQRHQAVRPDLRPDQRRSGRRRAG